MLSRFQQATPADLNETPIDLIAPRSDGLWAAWATTDDGYLYEIAAFRTLDEALSAYPGTPVSARWVA